MNEKNKQLRLTIDTNNVISGTISPGNYSGHLILSWSRGEFQWIHTPKTFQELQNVLRREKFKVKYGLQEDEVDGLLSAIAAGATFITPLSIFELPLHSRDKEDDKFLACALSGECDYLVSGDEDLLALNGRKELGRLEIITAYDYLAKTGQL